MSDLISTDQLRLLQTLYSQFERRSFEVGKSRAERLNWSTLMLDRKSRPVASWSKLTKAEAKILIDALQSSMGIAERSPAKRQSKSLRDRQKLGTEGRNDQIYDEHTILTGSESVFRLIQAEMTALGWDEARLKAFLRSRSGPNGGRDTLRTLGEANRTHWALKRIADRQRGASV